MFLHSPYGLRALLYWDQLLVRVRLSLRLCLYQSFGLERESSPSRWGAGGAHAARPWGSPGGEHRLQRGPRSEHDGERKGPLHQPVGTRTTRTSSKPQTWRTSPFPESRRDRPLSTAYCLAH